MSPKTVCFGRGKSMKRYPSQTIKVTKEKVASRKDKTDSGKGRGKAKAKANTTVGRHTIRGYRKEARKVPIKETPIRAQLRVKARRGKEKAKARKARVRKERRFTLGHTIGPNSTTKETPSAYTTS